MSLIETFIDAFTRAARQAGAVAMRLQGRVANEGKQGGSAEASALTAADLAAQDVLLLRLAEQLSDVAMDAEEETASARLFPPAAAGRPVVVVDPIDGTLSYVRGSRDYAVMGALLVDGRYVAAVLHFPAWGETLVARHRGGCVRQDARGREHGVRIGQLPRHLLIPPGMEPAWRALLQDAGFTTATSRCSAVEATAPVLGRALAALSFGTPDRRRAIGCLATVEAGGVVRIGARRWRGEDPAGLPSESGPSVVAASEAAADAVCAALGKAERRP